MTDIVQVEVLEVRRAGVKVKILEDNRVGFIRRRELSWDQRVGAIPPIPKIGEQFAAKVVRDDKYVHLSVRQLTDPWEAAEERFRLDQVVLGEIVHIRRFAAWVQLELGITAIIWPRDMPLLPEQLPEDVLAVGDQVQGIITSINWGERKIEISLTKRLRELSLLDAAERRSVQLDLFGETLAEGETGNGPRETVTTANEQSAPSRHYHFPIPRPERLLVIDNDPADLERIREYLEEALEVEADGVQSGQEALERMKQGLSYGLAVIDLRLANESGTQVAGDLLNLQFDLPVVFTSAAPLIEETVTNVYGQSFPFVDKDPEAIAELIDKLCSGYWEEGTESDATPYRGSGSFVHQLGMVALAQRSLPQTLQPLLARLRLETGVSQAVVFEVDSTNQLVSILAADPPLQEDIQQVMLDGLYFSPVQNVVEDEEDFYETRVTRRWHRRFRRLYQVLPFQLCLGIPLTIPDLMTRHALFLFDEERPELELDDLNKARLAANWIQVALERALLLDYMLRYEHRYFLGQLFGSLVHELSNKLDALGAQIETLPVLLQKINSSKDTEQLSEYLAQSQEVADGLANTRDELNELVGAYSRIASGDLEPVDVNAVVRKVELQLATKARETGISEICLEQQPDLPFARAIGSRLEQIVTNVVLNAIQQIGHQREFLAYIARRLGEDFSLLQRDQVIVQTCFVEDENCYPIQILVVDTGPGIHYHQQQDIFLLDTTTRPRGHGLGLFISRNLANSMGGRIRLVDSIMFVGSAFVVELPVFSEDGG